jgi:putative chitinase
VTPALLAAALAIPLARASLWAGPLAPALELAEINSVQRLACFLAQVGHESGRLRFARELWGPTPQQLRYEPGTELSARLGNVRPGDGRRYMGRGLIQVTGRANYARASAMLRALYGEVVPDFVVAPAMLEAPRWAALSASGYWRERGLNRYADAHDFVTLTRRINGGANGLADRQALYTQALGALTLDEVTP